jgi:hypothetical protein
LVERTLVGDQAQRDQRLASLVEFYAGHGQALTERWVSVVTESLGIRHGDQEEVEGTGVRAELIDIALTDQTLIHPAELFRHLAELVESDRAFVHAEDLLDHGVNDGEYRAPIVAGGGPSGRCHLVTRAR